MSRSLSIFIVVPILVLIVVEEIGTTIGTRMGNDNDHDEDRDNDRDCSNGWKEGRTTSRNVLLTLACSQTLKAGGGEDEELTTAFMKLTGCRVGLLISFNVSALKQGIKRMVL